jgi:hypothetical protein
VTHFNCWRSAKIAGEEYSCCNQKVAADIDQVDRAQEIAAGERRSKVEHSTRDDDVESEKGRRDAVNRRKLRPEAATTLRKDEREVHKQRRLQIRCSDAAPVDDPIEGIQLAAVVKTIQDEGNEAEDVKVNSAGRSPSAHENEEPYEEIQQRRNPQVVLDRRRVLLRLGDERHLERFAAAFDSVANFGPQSSAPEQAGDISRAVDRHPEDGLDIIALLDAGLSPRRAGNHMQGHDTVGSVRPGNAVIRCDEA